MTNILRRRWLLPLLLFSAALAVYWYSAVLLGRTHSPNEAYFDRLAEAFLGGHLYLTAPPSTADLTMYQGRWYVPFPPLPALLLMPGVALLGVARVNTVLYAALLGATNVALAFVLLRLLAARGWVRLRLADLLWLGALFGVGTVHWYMATLGSVWFLAQVCSLAFVLAAACAAVAGRPLLAGTALALAMLGRPHLALCYPLLLGIGVQLAGEHGLAGGKRRWGLLVAVPMLASAVLLLGYNAARFDNPFDFGYARQNVARELAGDLRTYGQFNLHYLPHNLWAMLLAGPVWEARRNQFLPSVDGMSLLLTTPALIYLGRAPQRSPLVLGAWLSIGLLLIPLLTYYNTGWWQFGYRFSLDFSTPVVLLLALNAKERLGWTMRALILLGVLINAWGVWWFLNPRFFQ
jgi:hypothetical protein